MVIKPEQLFFLYVLNEGKNNTGGGEQQQQPPPHHTTPHGKMGTKQTDNAAGHVCSAGYLSIYLPQEKRWTYETGDQYRPP